MSYDLMVFEPSAAPRERIAFMSWYDAQTEWSESHTYDDPRVSTPALREWFMHMITTFPPMNGPHATDDAEDSKLTDYSVGRTVIYAAFAWSEVQAAYEAVFRAAQEHRVGFFDVSAEDGDVWVPNGSGILERVPR